MTKKLKAALKIVDEVCGDFRGTRKEHVVIQVSLRLIHTALEQTPVADKLDKMKTPVKVPTKKVVRAKKKVERSRKRKR